MKKPNEIAHDETIMGTLVKLTGVFEGIASMRIAQTKNQVLQSTKFFNELWDIYSQLRVEENFGYGRDSHSNVINKQLYIIITAEGGLSGDIDQRLVQLMVKQYDKDKNDIIVIGHHGAIQLDQRNIPYKKFFKLPVHDRNINSEPIIKLVQQYKSTKMFYQEYVSLMFQDVREIELLAAVKQRGENDKDDENIISEHNYIFEPSTQAVAAHLERSMIQIAVSQLILESKLAQYASRFKAMTASHELASDAKNDLHLSYNRAKRAVKDERLKEIVNGIKKASGAAV